ncbi:GntR family transcriptional regulator [Nonomuraea sp. NPDC050643]|uniref:GntR family transcriptional regulator n=1 Tax=Nonomuraea sp. NPDC050643 TaxID=3155660 RepID=UPI0033D51DA3
MINYEADSPVYAQIAELLRARIERGEWEPRQRLPSVTHLEQEFGVARQTVLQALGVLRDLGIVYTVRNRGSFVKLGAGFVTVITVEPGMRIIVRQPSDSERRELDLPHDGSVVVVERPGAAVEVLPADKVEIRGPES